MIELDFDPRKNKSHQWRDYVVIRAQALSLSNQLVGWWLSAGPGKQYDSLYPLVRHEEFHCSSLPVPG